MTTFRNEVGKQKQRNYDRMPCWSGMNTSRWNVVDTAPFVCTVVPVVFLLLALLDWPYVYYQVLRLVVSVCGVILAYYHYDRVNKLDAIILLLGCMVVVYNPIKGPSFKRATWEIVNVATAVLLVVKLVVEKRRTDSIERSETLK